MRCRQATVVTNSHQGPPQKATTRKHVEIAAERAYCDGPPHCHKKALDQANALLAQLK